MGKHVDPERVEICWCDRPWWDPQEGRYCPECCDYVRTCWNDHCEECGSDT